MNELKPVKQTAFDWLKSQAQDLEMGDQEQRAIASILRMTRYAISIGELPEFLKYCRDFGHCDDTEDEVQA